MKFILMLSLLVASLSSNAAGRISEYKLRDNLSTEIVSLQSMAKSDLVVLVAYGVECPILGKHVPTIKHLISNYETKGINFIFINSIKRSPEQEISDALKNFDLNVHVYHDNEGTMLKTLGFSTLSEVALIRLSTNEVLYRGAINNQFTLDLSRKIATKNYLQDAIDSAIKKEKITINNIKPFGCEITF